jgi:hypothetical protein
MDESVKNEALALAFEIATDALEYYADMAPGVERREGGAIAAQALGAIEALLEETAQAGEIKPERFDQRREIFLNCLRRRHPGWDFDMVVRAKRHGLLLQNESADLLSAEVAKIPDED